MGMILGSLVLSLAYVSCTQPSSSEPGQLSSAPPAAARHARDVVRAWRFFFGLAETPAIAMAQIHQESLFNCTAVSRSGAQGCAQFMPRTAKAIAAKLPPEVRQACLNPNGCPFDPRWSFYALAKYDYDLHQSYANTATPLDRWGFTLAAYNGGPTWLNAERAVCRAHRTCKNARYFQHVQSFCGKTGRSKAACAENTSYPERVLFTLMPMYKERFNL